MEKLLITIKGNRGSGKTYLINTLEKYLKGQGYFIGSTTAIKTEETLEIANYYSAKISERS